MLVIECCEKPCVFGQQHPVTKHVAGHVADTGYREWLVLHISAEFPEMPLHRLPGAASRDAHLLVVVPV